MKKVIRLTESDLVRLVKNVIKEQKEETLREMIQREPEAKVDLSKKHYVFIQNASEKLVNKVLSLLRGIDELNGEIKFMSIQDCEGADFSGANICSLYGLMSVSTKGTPNNFVDTVDCEFDVAKDYLFLMKEK